MKIKKYILKNKERVIAFLLLFVCAFLFWLMPLSSNASSTAINVPGICCSSEAKKANALAETEKSKEESETISAYPPKYDTNFNQW